MLLRPPAPTRAANSSIGVLSAAFGALGTLFPDSWEFYLWAPALLVSGVVLAVRGYRLAVVCLGNAVVVRGFVRTTTIPWHDVVSVQSNLLGYPSIRRRGRPWWRSQVPVAAFWVSDGTLIPAVHERARRNRARLVQALASYRETNPTL